MKRKLAIFAAALIIPGGFLALFAAWLAQVLSRTERGQRYLAAARTSLQPIAASLRATWAPAATRWRNVELLPDFARRTEIA